MLKINFLLTLTALVACYSSAVSNTNVNASSNQTVTLESLLDEMVAFEACTYFPDYQCFQQSSYDRRSTLGASNADWFANSDGSGFIRTESIDGRTEKVLFENTAPGVITRFWLTTQDRRGVLRFYFDGAVSPDVVVPAYDMTQFVVPVGYGLCQPHINNLDGGRGGSTFYLPLPYAKSCKITLEEPTPDFSTPRYYQINYRQYPKNKRIETFSLGVANRALAKINSVSQLMLQTPTFKGGKTTEASKTLSTGETFAIDLPKGGYAVKMLEISVSSHILEDITIGAQFDNTITISNIPLSDFSGGGAGAHQVESRFLSSDGKGNLTCRYPMPYKSTGRLIFSNKSGKSVTVSVKALTDKYKWSENSLYFNVSRREQKAIPLTGDLKNCIEWAFADLKGRGVYRGDVLTLCNHSPRWYGEGDEKIYVDGEAFPSHFGTGTEDYYNTSWAPVKPFQTPFGGAPRADLESSAGYNTFFRLRYLDDIPFTENLKFNLEMISWEPGTADYAATVFWYGDANASVATVSSKQTEDILIADFEASGYGAWRVEGNAFGTAPAQGGFDNQMETAGYTGSRLVNSFAGGDDSKGKLTSPEFTIERDYIDFLIGGGGFEDITCMNLLIDGKTVRQATGGNTQSGGSERLDWKSWQVSEYKGKKAVIQIIDDATGGWGHINVDNIIQSDTPLGVSVAAYQPKEDITREITLTQPFLHIPVKTGNPQRWLQLTVGGRVVREFTVELADADEKPDFYGTLEVSEWLGQKGVLKAVRMPEGSKALSKVVASDALADSETVYNEPFRPKYHFTARRGWINDPNGLLYYSGEYHLFAQHNPFGVKWENMSWAHAVSKDLLHWTESPDALLPDELGTMFSGSGVVDSKNTSGFGVGKEKPLVLIYTAAGGSNRLSAEKPFTQCIAYSTDGGKKWTKYDGNPVLEHIEGGNRDPKVFWHEPSKQWVMALYLDREDYALFGSPNLKQWSKLCDIRNLGCSECPDMFELPVDGNPKNTRWVFWGGNGMYLIGAFDGKTFTPESKPLKAKWGGNDYAAQSYSDTPGRRIQFSWMQSSDIYPEMPFNQQYTVPRELTLRTTEDGIRLITSPVKELKTLRMSGSPAVTKKKVVLENGQTFRQELSQRAAEIELTLDVSQSPALEITVFGHTLTYNPAEKKLGEMPVEPIKGKIKLHIFTDVSSVEYFVNDGITQYAVCFKPSDVKQEAFSITATGSSSTIDSLAVYKLENTYR
jgi:fructan beta-fructosidase